MLDGLSSRTTGYKHLHTKPFQDPVRPLSNLSPTEYAQHILELPVFGLPAERCLPAPCGFDDVVQLRLTWAPAEEAIVVGHHHAATRDGGSWTSFTRRVDATARSAGTTCQQYGQRRSQQP